MSQFRKSQDYYANLSINKKRDASMATENTNEEQIMNNFNDKTADIFISKIMNDELI